jgi:hypothetical protein
VGGEKEEGEISGKHVRRSLVEVIPEVGRGEEERIGTEIDEVKETKKEGVEVEMGEAGWEEKAKDREATEGEDIGEGGGCERGREGREGRGRGRGGAPTHRGGGVTNCVETVEGLEEEDGEKVELVEGDEEIKAKGLAARGKNAVGGSCRERRGEVAESGKKVWGTGDGVRVRHRRNEESLGVDGGGRGTGKPERLTEESGKAVGGGGLQPPAGAFVALWVE